ncbi:MAG: hypothetical protein Q8R11_01045 [bacterium]|nr:hypothetical protein [bacterium]
MSLKEIQDFWIDLAVQLEDETLSRKSEKETLDEIFSTIDNEVLVSIIRSVVVTEERLNFNLQNDSDREKRNQLFSLYGVLEYYQVAGLNSTQMTKLRKSLLDCFDL